MWLENRRRQKGKNSKLQAKFQGPYTVVQSWANHTYRIERHRQTFIQNECPLKAFRPCPEEVGRAPVMLEPNRRPNMRGMTRRRERTPSPEPWLIPPANPPAIELPIPPSSREQADKAFMSYQREEIWDPEVLTEGMTPPLRLSSILEPV